MFSSPKIPQERRALNIAPDRAATNQEAVPLPFFAGAHPCPAHWLGEAYNQRTTPIKQKVGKKSSVTGFNYYADCAALLCAGPVRRATQIEIDGVAAWTGNLERDGSNVHYGEVDVPNYGTFRIYWGTDSQPKDDLVLGQSTVAVDIDPAISPWEFDETNGTRRTETYTTAACPDNHPRYLRQCYFVAKQLFCGQDRTSLPSVVIVIEREANPAGLSIGSDALSLTHEGANPVGFLAEVWTSPYFGLGMPTASIDEASWLTEADARTRSTAMPLPGAPGHTAYMGNLSPVLDSQTSFRAFVGKLLEYWDGWIRAKGDTLELGRFPHDGVEPGGLLEISLHDLTEDPELDSPGLEDAVTSFTIEHRDRSRNFKEDASTHKDPGALERIGEPRSGSAGMPWFITRHQAREMAEVRCNESNQPGFEAPGQRVRRGKLGDTRPGDLVVFDYGPNSLDIICRVTRRLDPSSGGEVEVDLIAERGLSPLAYVPPSDDRPVTAAPSPVVIANAKILQLPHSFDGEPDPNPAIVVLAQRPTANTAGLNIHYSDDNTTFDQLAVLRQWAVRGTLISNINTTAATLALTVTGEDLPKLQPYSAAAQADDEFILAMGLEVFSVGAVTADGSNQYTLSVLRKRRGTAVASHTAGAVGWLIRRAEMLQIQHADFPRSVANRYFKLQAFTPAEEQALGDALAITLAFADTGVEDPTNLDAVAKAEAVNLSFDVPDTADIASAQFWERTAATPVPVDGDTPDFTSPVIPGETFSKLRGGLTAGTQLWFWVRLRDSIASLGNIVEIGTATPTAPPAGTDGTPGSLTSFVFKNAATQPTTPTGGSFDGSAEVLPSGVTDNPTAPADGELSWVSRARYSYNGTAWVRSSDWSAFSPWFQKGDSGTSIVGIGVVDNAHSDGSAFESLDPPLRLTVTRDGEVASILVNIQEAVNGDLGGTNIAYSIKREATTLVSTSDITLGSYGADTGREISVTDTASGEVTYELLVKNSATNDVYVDASLYIKQG